MAWPWNSELRLDLRIGGCMAELHGAGFTRRLKASASAAGTGATAISAALSALRLVDEGSLLPSDARLIVADEYVFYALLDARSTVQQALADATEQFQHALAREDLVVQVAPLPAGHGWLAAAVPEAHLHAWADALADAGVRLQHLHPALVVDLARISRQVREDEAVVALLRDHGATFVRIGTGVPTALAWEPFDTEDRGALDLRLQAFVANTAPAGETSAGRRRTSPAGEAIYLYDTGKVLRRYGSSIDDRPADSLPPSDTLEPSAFEAAFAADVFDHRFAAMQAGGPPGLPGARANPPPRRDAAVATPAGPEARHIVRPGQGARPLTQAAAALPPSAPGAAATAPAVDSDAAGGARIKALADKLRGALQRSRANRAERRRLWAEARAADGARRDFSPTGSVLPDEWQDTEQFDPDRVDTVQPAHADTHHWSAASEAYDDPYDEEAMLDLAFLPAAALGAGGAVAPAAAPRHPEPHASMRRNSAFGAPSSGPWSAAERRLPAASGTHDADRGAGTANPWRRPTASPQAGPQAGPHASPAVRRGRPVLTVVGGSDVPSDAGQRAQTGASRHPPWAEGAEPPVLERVVLRPGSERRRP